MRVCGGAALGDKGRSFRGRLWPQGPCSLWPRRPHLPSSEEPARHPPRKRRTARASGEVRAARPPLRRFAASGPQRSSRPSRGGDRVAPTGIRDSSRAGTFGGKPARRHPGTSRAEGLSRAEGGRHPGWEAPTPA